MLIRILLVITFILLFSFLFKKISGSLKLDKLNMLSLIYYYILAFNVIGSSLIYIGFREHYLISKMRYPELIDFGYYVIVYALLVFPFTIYIMKRTFLKKLSDYSFNNFISEKVYIKKDMRFLEYAFFLMVLLCIISVSYLYMYLLYNPIKVILNGHIASTSIQNAFIGDPYIKNIFSLALPNILVFYSYIYYRVTKSKVWITFFCILTILVILGTIHNFSKALIINFFLGLYLVEVILGNIKSIKNFITLILICTLIIICTYVYVLKTDYTSILSIYFGPLGRILFTQISTLFLHIDVFPNIHPFLEGASFNSWMSFFISNAAGIRSGRVVMEVYNQSGIADGTAGVMNTLFIGEAYANFGIIGVLIAPIIFGLVIGFFSIVLINMKKTPIVILLYVKLTFLFITIIEGGFIDIIYNFNIIFLLIVVMILSFCSKIVNNNYNSNVVE